MPLTRDEIRSALRHLRKRDPVMKQVIADVGPFTLRLQRDRFKMLVRSIISQQISASAARTIRERLEEQLAPSTISPAALLSCNVDELRTAGLSRQKATYLLDLAAKVDHGTVRLTTIGRLTDDDIIGQLTQVHGIGRWTAQMFLIFALGRPDVFPESDLGVRTAIRIRYELDELPDKATSHRIARPWRPYASVASWYCWRSLEQ